MSNGAIARNTDKKYLAAESREMVGAVATPSRSLSVTIANHTNGQKPLNN